MCRSQDGNCSLSLCRYNNNVFQIYFSWPGSPKFLAVFEKNLVCIDTHAPLLFGLRLSSHLCSLFLHTLLPDTILLMWLSCRRLLFGGVLLFSVFLWVYGGGGVDASLCLGNFQQRREGVCRANPGECRVGLGCGVGKLTVQFFTKNSQAIRMVVFTAGRILAAFFSKIIYNLERSEYFVQH